MSEKNRVYFKTYSEAVEAGYIPCKACRPDLEKPGAAAGALSNAEAAPYIGHQRTKKLHRAECRWARKISPSNRVYFNSYDEAARAGYVPCKVCKPGAPMITEGLDSF
ncbi:TPA: hypothetical protein EYP12_06360 [Candidatus Bipolaricaulota bacterium]|nr:hypothetical protein [Candidatus Bipolaricaulota bacterium]